MSYILEALRKSDQQRQRGAAPTLLAVQTTTVVRKQPTFLLYGLLAAVLLGSGVGIGWLRPWEPESATSARPESAPARPVELTPRHPAPSTSNTAAQPIPQPDVQIAMEPAQAPAASETVLQPQLLPKPQPKAKPQTKAELSARVKPPADGRSSAAGAHTPGRTAAPVSLPSPDSADAVVALPTVISMAELPPSVRQELPALKISVHAYSSNPSARLVGIDYRILHEGDNVVPGLKLEQITPEGMIFDYKGYRFSHGVK